MLTIKYFPAIIIGMLLIWANFQCMKWYIQKLLSKNTGGSEQAVFPERKVECIKSLNRPGPVNTNTK